MIGIKIHTVLSSVGDKFIKDRWYFEMENIILYTT